MIPREGVESNPGVVNSLTIGEVIPREGVESIPEVLGVNVVISE